MFNQLRHLFRSDERKPYRLFQIETSLDCSLSCVMCPWLELRGSGAVMSWETFSRIAEDFHLTEGIDLTGGGEPLTNPRILDMVIAARIAGCEVGFSSNGTRLTPQLAGGLISQKLDWISFSIDAATDDLYARIRQGAHLHQVLSNIRELRDQKNKAGSLFPRMLAVFVMMIGEQQNYHELPAFIELAHSLGIEQVIAKNLDVILKDGDDQRRIFSHDGELAVEIEESIHEAQRRADHFGIGLRLYSLRPQEVPVCEHDPLRSAFFNWQGNVSPCITLAYAENRIFNGERVFEPCMQFGNINEERLRSMWNKEDYIRFRDQFAARQKAEQHASVDFLLGGNVEVAIPAAPESCRTCYYLYGI